MTTECRLGAADETIADPETPVGSRRRVSTPARPNSRTSKIGCCALSPIKKILDAERSESARMQSDSRRRS